MSDPRIVIIGAGPTGIGAAFYLHQIGYNNWKMYEREPYVGGLSASFTDPQGFMWDQGGHVTFSHYKYFDDLVAFSCRDKLLTHTRDASAFMMNRFVPYPVQNNIRYLEKDVILSCVLGLLDRPSAGFKPANFREWILASFGKGLAEIFMYPYNEKIWSYDLSAMNYTWVGERVSMVDTKHVLTNLVLEQDDINWGPNRYFSFPESGGTQAIYAPVGKVVGDHLALNAELSQVQIKEKKVLFKDGSADTYDYLISSVPLDEFMTFAVGDDSGFDSACDAARRLVSNIALIAGVGVARRNNVKRCWIYFPEKEYPCYRATYFSNYSPKNVPGDEYFSLMGEIGFPSGATIEPEKVVANTVESFIRCGFMSPLDRDRIASLYHRIIPKAYPVPTVDRDEILAHVQPYLMKNQIFSRGRFGGWKYEVGNMDHSVMQGKEAVDCILNRQPETVYPAV